MGKRDGHLYILEGDITPLTRSVDKKRIWDYITEFRINNHISLQHQHGEHDKLQGPLHMDCTFYLPFHGSDTKAKQYKNRYHMAKPYLSGLLILVETVGIDIIFRSTSNIVSVALQKLYDNDRPRVEFKLFEIKIKDEQEKIKDEQVKAGE